MKKKNALFGLLTLSSACLISTAVFVNAKDSIINQFATLANDSYTFGLNSANAPAALTDAKTNFDATLHTINGNPIVVHYESAIKENGAHVKLAAGGSLSGKDALSGFKSIKASFDGKLLISYGYDENHLVSTVPLTASYETFNESGYNYFKITAVEDSVITSLSFDYSCNRVTTSIEGKITDIAGNALSGVTVKAYNGETATTDTKGAYEFKNVELGSYMLTASKEGYKDTDVPVQLSGNAATSANAAMLEVDQTYIGKNGGTNTNRYDIYLKRTDDAIVFDAITEDVIEQDAGVYELWLAPDVRAMNRQRDDVLYVRGYCNGTAPVVKTYKNDTQTVINNHGVTVNVKKNVITITVPYSTIALGKKDAFTLTKLMDVGFTCDSINANNQIDALKSGDIPTLRNNYSESTELARGSTCQYLVFKTDGTLESQRNYSLNIYEFADLVNASSAHKNGVDFSRAALATVNEEETNVKQIAPSDTINYMYSNRETHSWWANSMLNAIKGMYFNYGPVDQFSSITVQESGYVIYCGHNDMPLSGLDSRFVRIIKDGPAIGAKVHKNSDYYVGYFEAGTRITATAKDGIFVFDSNATKIATPGFEELPENTFDAGLIGNGSTTPIQRVFVTKKDTGIEYNIFTKDDIDSSKDQGVEAYLALKSGETRSTTTFTFKFLQNGNFTAKYWKNNTQTDLSYTTGITVTAEGKLVKGFVPYEVFNKAEPRLNISKDSDFAFSTNSINKNAFTVNYGYNIPLVSSWVNGEITRGQTKNYYWFTGNNVVSDRPSDFTFNQLATAVNGSDAFNGVEFSKETLATLEEGNLAKIEMYGKLFTNRQELGQHFWTNKCCSALKEMHYVYRNIGSTVTHTVSRSGYVVMMSIDSTVVDNQYKTVVDIINNPGLITGKGYDLIKLYGRYVYAGEQINVTSDSVLFVK